MLFCTPIFSWCNYVLLTKYKQCANVYTANTLFFYENVMITWACSTTKCYLCAWVGSWDYSPFSGWNRNWCEWFHFCQWTRQLLTRQSTRMNVFSCPTYTCLCSYHPPLAASSTNFTVADSRFSLKHMNHHFVCEFSHFAEWCYIFYCDTQRRLSYVPCSKMPGLPKMRCLSGLFCV